MLLALLPAAGCGSGKEPRRAPGATLTVYESLPREGPSARTSAAVAAGARLALSDAGGHAGGRRVRIAPLDSSRPGAETWDPSAVEANAKRAAGDATAIAYIGELGDGASAISLPVTNAKGLLQVAPLEGLTGLTRDEAGGAPSSRPERFYPSGARTFLRLVPSDASEAGTLAGWVRARGARRVVVIQDEQVAGREQAAAFRYAAQRLGITIADGIEVSGDSGGYPAVVKRIAAARPDAVVYTGVGDRAAGTLLGAIGTVLPAVPLFGGSSLATAEPAPPGLPEVSVVKPALAPSAYGPPARRALARLARALGAPAPAEALYGYEAMRVVLDAVGAAGSRSGDRGAVVRAALRPRARSSLLGLYRVTASGDVDPARFGSFHRRGEHLAFRGSRYPAAARRRTDP